MVALSLALLAGFAALAVDYAFLRHKMNRLRKAAEDSSLVGAAMLVPLGAALQTVRDETVRAGQAVLDRDDSPELAIRASDVVFLHDGTAAESPPDQVEVTAGRTGARGNPVRLFLGKILGQRFADVSASGRAGLYCAGAASGMAPLAVAEKFTWDDACDPEPGRRGNGALDAQSPCETASLRVVGYGSGDVGTRIALRPGRMGLVSPGDCYVLEGAASGHTETGEPGMGAYGLTSLAGGRQGLRVAVADELRLDPGERAARWFRQAMARYVEMDDGAFWDDFTGVVAGSRYRDPGKSPRVLRLAFFDPSRPPSPGREVVRASRLGAVFIEAVSGNGDVVGRLVRALGVSPTPAAGPCDPESVGLYGVRLVRIAEEERMD